jgi:hypothetical protein
MPDTTETLIGALRAWAVDANVRAAVDLLAEQDHWFWDEKFMAACVGQTGSTTWISWQQADAYLQSGPPCSGGEQAILRIAIDLGSGRWQIDTLDGRNRARVVAAVQQAVGQR